MSEDVRKAFETMKATVDPHRIPRHVGIIMDGNGRWANARGLHRTQGHAAGEPALFDVVHGALALGIEWLTVYTFSTENWARDAFEVEFLMQFNVDLLERRRDELDELGVRVVFSGDRTDERIPPEVLKRMEIAERQIPGGPIPLSCHIGLCPQQVRKACQQIQPVGVLRQPAVANFVVTELALYPMETVLHLSPDTGL